MINKLLFFFTALLLNCSSTKESNWYYPWDNNANSMEAASDLEIIPALINGSNYRILRINNFQGDNFQDFSYQSKNSKIEIFQLPMIKNHNKKDIFDLILPLTKNEKFYDTNKSKYFLLKFTSHQKGNEKVSISLSSNTKKYNYTKQIKTGNFSYKSPLSLNVFAYFDYNFLVKDVKTQVIKDLANHGNNVLVIPPSVLPQLSQKTFENNALKNYIKGTENTCKYYLLYFNFTDHKIDFAKPEVQKNMLVWYKSIMEAFEENNIQRDNVLLFPYDEPQNSQVNELLSLYKICRNLGIQNPFYVTINNVEAGKTLIPKIEFVQGIPEIMTQLKNVKPKSELWLYELTYGSRDRKATEYRDMSITAFKNKATGIGLWSYADIDRSVDIKGQAQFSRGVATWDIDYASPSAEYSLIYRKNNIIYSSLRWEAVSFGMQDYFWLQLYKNKYGSQKIENLENSINGLSEKERDEFKLKILN